MVRETIDRFGKRFRHKSLILFLSVVIAIVSLSGCQEFFGYQSVTLEFPETVSLGQLSIIEDVNCFTCGNGQQSLGEAKGRHKINLPYRWFIA